MRSLIAKLSTDNLLHNLATIKKLAKNSKIIAMVKANAYGHGLRSIALRLQRDVDFVGVAAIDEALQLRKAGINIPIVLIEGIFEPEELIVAAKQNFVVVFHNELQLNWLNNIHVNIDRQLHAWLKIDTGMGRLGFNIQEAHNIYYSLINNPNIAKPLGIMSHFACADECNHNLNNIQIANFNNFTNKLNLDNNKDLLYRSFCNSAAIFHFPQQHYEVVRPGLALYGTSPILGKTARDLALKPVMTLESSIIAVKTLPKNSCVGYGAEFVCPEDLKVAIIAVGYGDGYPRITKPNMPILVNGKRCNIIGRVSMDMAAVDLKNCKDAKIGDPVVLWGDNLPIEEIVKYTNKSVYDLLTGVQNRVRFKWN